MTTTDFEIMFWLLTIVGIIALIGVLATAKSLSVFVKSNAFIEGLKKVKDKGTAILFLTLSALPLEVLAQEVERVDMSYRPLFEIGQREVIVVLIIDLVLLGVILFLRNMLKQMLDMVNPAPAVESLSPKEKKQRSFGWKLNKTLTDIVDIEDEDSILLDHEYDGIQELDNNLPPWWTYGFYLTILVAFLYLMNYHVLGTGDLQIEAYKKDVAEAEAEVMAYLDKMALNVDENTVVMLNDVVDIEKGHAIFSKNCAVCHLEDGGGQVGPNLTDDYWIYGPDMKSIFKTVKYGANNGMTAWKEKLTPVEMQQVSSFIRTLHGTTPAIAKEAQGEFFEFVNDEEAITEAASDTIVVIQ